MNTPLRRRRKFLRGAAGGDSMKSMELKPCPFCGGKARIANHSYGVASVVVCQQCHVLFAFPWNKTETVNDLYEEWNRRDPCLWKSE